MEPSVIFVIYQNQLIAEGLECILRQNNFKAFKNNITELKQLKPEQISKAGLLIIEAIYPFPQLESIIDNIVLLFGENAKIILLSNLINKNIFHQVSENKIQGIVLKSSSADEFIFGIKQVLDGKRYYSSLVTNVFLKNKTGAQKLSVSTREKEILTLLGEMNSTEEIANKLSITKSTVKTHRRNLMRKFNSKNTLCLLRSACRENLLTTENNFCGCCYKQILEI